jgi:hypothetical protein
MASAYDSSQLASLPAPMNVGHVGGKFISGMWSVCTGSCSERELGVSERHG